jgi:histone demethylase JARID1
MTERELKDRKKARDMGLWETLEKEDRPEEQYQCMICKSFCYLSQVTCQCSNKVVCVDHADFLCDRGMSHLILRKRLSDEDILEIQTKVAERAAIPSLWRGKFNKVLMENARPQLRSLRALLSEGDRINYPLPELASLRKCVTRANDWIDAANAFIIRKQSRKRSRRSRGRPPLNESTANVIDEPVDRPDRGLDDLYSLLREVDNMGFDCPEIELLRTLAHQSETTQSKARTLLESADLNRDRDGFIQECERLLLEGSSLNVNLDELAEVEKIVMREQLIKELEEKLEDSSMTLEEVRQLLTRAHACSLPADNKHMRILESRQRAGGNWEERARNVLAQPYKTTEELEEISDIDPSIPIDPTVLDRLMAALAKARDFEKQAEAWLTPEAEGSRPRVQDVLRLVARAEKDFSIPAIKDLKRTADFALDLETRCEQVLKNRYLHRDEVGEENDIFDTMRKWRAYARDHLDMFILPAFEKLDEQLNLHYRWLEGLPWYCREHQEAHSQQILEDVIESTRPEDDLPPSDEFFTCICTTAVRPPPPGTISDAVQCDHCFARFHGVCAANGGSCPFCDHHHWNGAIHKERSWHFCFLPTILLSAPEITRNYSREWKQLEIIVHRLDRLSSVIGQFLSFASQPGNQRVEYIAQVRHYMRKLYKIQFAVSPSREVSFGLDLAGLHRILAGQPPPVRMKKRRRPKFTFGQDIDNDYSDGTRCICRGGRPPYYNRTVECEICAKLYHVTCVFFPPVDAGSTTKSYFTCPLCCLRKNRTYPFAQVRVKPMGTFC